MIKEKYGSIRRIASKSLKELEDKRWAEVVWAKICADKRFGAPFVEGRVKRNWRRDVCAFFEWDKSTLSRSDDLEACFFSALARMSTGERTHVNLQLGISETEYSSSTREQRNAAIHSLLRRIVEVRGDVDLDALGIDLADEATLDAFNEAALDLGLVDPDMVDAEDVWVASVDEITEALPEYFPLSQDQDRAEILVRLVADTQGVVSLLDYKLVIPLFAVLLAPKATRAGQHENTLNRAISLVDKRQFSEAIQLLSLIVASEPSNRTALFYRGRCHRHLRQFNEGIRDLTSLLQLTLDPSSLVERAICFSGIKDYNSAVRDLTKVIKFPAIDPVLRSKALKNRSRCFGNLREFDKAVVDISAVLSEDAKDVASRLLRARFYVDMKDNANAIADLRRCTEFDPKNDVALNELGALLNLEGDHDEAITTFTQYFALGGDDANAYWLRGNSLRATGRREAAIQDLTEAIERSPQHIGAHFDRGSILGELKDYDRSIADLTMCVELEVNTRRRAQHLQQRGYAYSLKAGSLEKSGDRKESLAFFRRSLADYQSALRLHSSQDKKRACEERIRHVKQWIEYLS